MNKIAASVALVIRIFVPQGIRRQGRAGAGMAALALAPWLAWAASPSATAGGPLVVNGNSHVVVMEYEAWFGPKAVTFQGSSAIPLLQSTDRKSTRLNSSHLGI